MGEASKEEVESPFLDVFKERVHVLLGALSNAVRLGKKGMGVRRSVKYISKKQKKKSRNLGCRSY